MLFFQPLLCSCQQAAAGSMLSSDAAVAAGASSLASAAPISRCICISSSSHNSRVDHSSHVFAALLYSRVCRRRPDVPANTGHCCSSYRPRMPFLVTVCGSKSRRKSSCEPQSLTTQATHVRLLCAAHPRVSAAGLIWPCMQLPVLVDCEPVMSHLLLCCCPSCQSAAAVQAAPLLEQLLQHLQENPQAFLQWALLEP
jgi:hypothetical protein